MAFFLDFYTNILIFVLNILKLFWFWNTYKKKKKKWVIYLLQKYQIHIFKASIISIILLLLYLILARLILGWYFRWIIPVYLLYFFSSVFLDAYFFGLKEIQTKEIFKLNSFYRKTNNFLRDSIISQSFRILKLFYYFIFLIIGSFYFFFGLFIIPIPTIDSIYDADVFYSGKQRVEKRTIEIYPFFDDEKFVKQELKLFNKILIKGGDKSLKFFELKTPFFIKYIFETGSSESVSIFLNNEYIMRIERLNSIALIGNNYNFKQAINSKEKIDAVIKDIKLKRANFILDSMHKDDYYNQIRIKFELEQVILEYGNLITHNLK